jgi:hypothetical protein
MFCWWYCVFELIFCHRAWRRNSVIAPDICGFTVEDASGPTRESKQKQKKKYKIVTVVFQLKTVTREFDQRLADRLKRQRRTN